MQREQANKLYATLMVNNQNKRKYKKQGEMGLPAVLMPALCQAPRRWAAWLFSSLVWIFKKCFFSSLSFWSSLISPYYSSTSASWYLDFVRLITGWLMLSFQCQPSILRCRSLRELMFSYDFSCTSRCSDFTVFLTLSKKQPVKQF